MILITDDVQKAIEHDIASHKPEHSFKEKGGALFGPAHTNLISKFLYDIDAKTSAVTYTPSSQLVIEVKEVERSENLTFKGILHSHPGGFDRPSSADLHGFANNLAHNPHMGRFIAPIVTMVTGNPELATILTKLRLEKMPSSAVLQPSVLANINSPHALLTLAPAR